MIILLLPISFGIYKLNEKFDLSPGISNGEETQIETRLSSNQLSANEILNVDFSFENEMKKWRYEATGMDVIDKKTSKRKISIELRAEKGEGKFYLYVDFGNGGPGNGGKGGKGGDGGTGGAGGGKGGGGMSGNDGSDGIPGADGEGS